MNRTMCFRLVALSMLLCLVGTLAVAAPFDPVFRVLRLKGLCQVALPDSSDFSPVKPGKAYPYGSTLRTGNADAEAVVALCDNHECRLMANTTARVSGEDKDRENRTVHLLAGRVEVDLDQKNQRFTNRVFVQTAVATAAGEKVRFAVTASRNGDIHESVFECNAGMLGVGGSQFGAPVVKEGASVKVTGQTDLSWLRAQTLKGDVSYDLRGSNGDQMTYPTKAGGAVKINQRVIESTKARHVVLWLLKSDGTTETNYTYKVMPQVVDDGGATGADTANRQTP